MGLEGDEGRMETGATAANSNRALEQPRGAGQEGAREVPGVADSR